jgi:hypothetical protein
LIAVGVDRFEHGVAATEAAEATAARTFLATALAAASIAALAALTPFGRRIRVVFLRFIRIPRGGALGALRPRRWGVIFGAGRLSRGAGRRKNTQGEGPNVP